MSKKRFSWRKILTALVFVSLLLSILFAAYHVVFPPQGNISTPAKPQSDYMLMIVQCALGIFVMFLPSIIGKKLKFEIPDNMYLLFVIFLYCAIYLGEVRSFYYLVPHWDSILHTFSGAMLGAFGFSIINLLNNDDKIAMRLSPLFVCVFAFCFAVALGVVWEIYEFTLDGLMRLNMQKALLEDGTALVGRSALSDTMKDLIVDVLGALAVTLIGFFSIKKDKRNIQKMELKRTE